MLLIYDFCFVIGLIYISISHHIAYIISTLIHGEGEETQIKVKQTETEKRALKAQSSTKANA